MCNTNAQGTYPCLLVGRSDQPVVCVLDTLLPANNGFLLFQSHMVGNGQNSIRPLQMIVQGEGTVTAGAAVLVCDQIRYSPMQAVMFPNDPLQDCLLDIRFAGDMSCRQWSVVIAISGFGLVIRSQIAVNGQVGT